MDSVYVKTQIKTFKNADDVEINTWLSKNANDIEVVSILRSYPSTSTWNVVTIVFKVFK